MYVTLAIALTLGLVLGMSLLTTVILTRSLLYISGPGEVLVFSGRTYPLPDGSVRGYRVVKGRAFRIPLLEQAERFSLGPWTVQAERDGAEVIGEIRVDETRIDRAIERFLGREEAVVEVARDYLSAALRAALNDPRSEDDTYLGLAVVEQAGPPLTEVGLGLETVVAAHRETRS